MYAAKGNHPHCCNELLLREADVTMSNLNDDTAYTLAVDNKSTLGEFFIINIFQYLFNDCFFSFTAQAVVENYLLTLLGS